jgi:xanthine dehydrogenase YagR molybdenum-binding subunit
MGIGMAMTEETMFDDRTGRIMNATLAEYHLPVQADVPHIDVIFTDVPDPLTPLGAHGIGEIGITAVAARPSRTRFITQTVSALPACQSRSTSFFER